MGINPAAPVTLLGVPLFVIDCCIKKSPKPVTFSSFLLIGKAEESLESTEAFRVVEQSVQKPVADSSAPAYIPSKPPASTPPSWDGKKRGDPLGEPVAFPQGLPAGAEEQRQFLTEQCIASFCLCLSRFPQHYKSLYRLAFLYTYSKTHRVRRALERGAGYEDGRCVQTGGLEGRRADKAHWTLRSGLR